MTDDDYVPDPENVLEQTGYNWEALAQRVRTKIRANQQRNWAQSQQTTLP